MQVNGVEIESWRYRLKAKRARSVVLNVTGLMSKPTSLNIKTNAVAIQGQSFFHRADAAKITERVVTLQPSEETVTVQVSSRTADHGKEFRAIRWVLDIEPHQIPSEPFHLAPHLKILDPVAWLQKLQREVSADIAGLTTNSPRPVRGKCGALAAEVNYFRQYLQSHPTR